MKYEPWTDGTAVGFKFTSPGGAVGYVYLNPSSADSEGVANVFVYQGHYGDPAMDTAITHINQEPARPNTALVGKRVRLLKPDFDSNENDNRREIPVGTLGVISAVAHVDRDGLTNYDLLWDNGGWTIYTEAEVATDMEVISGT